MEQSEVRKTVERIAEKYADLVEQRIESTEELTGTDLRDIYDGIQMLGHIVATLERFSRMRNATEPYPRATD